KTKARLAAAIGRTVGTKLLTPEDLARAVDQPAFREAFDNQLQRFLADLLNRERGSLMEELPAALAVELRALLDDAAAALLVRFDAYLASGEFRDGARRR